MLDPPHAEKLQKGDQLGEHERVRHGIQPDISQRRSQRHHGFQRFKIRREGLVLSGNILFVIKTSFSFRKLDDGIDISFGRFSMVS